jgi:hypothetical protein
MSGRAGRIEKKNEEFVPNSDGNAQLEARGKNGEILLA